MKRIGVAGVAHIHMPNFATRLKARPGVEVVAVWDPEPVRAEKYAGELGCKVVSRVEDLWKEADAEAVVVCSETNRHKEIVLAAAAAGMDLFVEKPLGFSAADAIEMAAAIERAGVVFQTGYFMRGASVHRELKRLVDGGVFGTVTRVRHVNCHSGSLGGWFDTDFRWMADPAVAGCGAFGDLGTHSLDILMWLFGKPESVTADISVVTGRYGETCDETGTALLKFPGGAVGTLCGGWVDVMNPVTCEVSGSEGFAYIRNGELFVKSDRLGTDGSAPWSELPEALPHAFELFLDALEGRDVPLVSASEAAQRNVVMEALYRAARTHTWVSL
ncbi:Gfo/Idh/MocA family oxidoreductase [uncultured Victivallis sp.]|uniref:Gfo/Idh/MocA family protein n=1 Tax=uncultured Victivallis sp. TaxID=354118 RepID=UPI0025D4434C|nr:Gfo/Idh/MocA family oxidoreductase [uncultured Victivallis sp.]